MKWIQLSIIFSLACWITGCRAAGYHTLAQDFRFPAKFDMFKELMKKHYVADDRETQSQDDEPPQEVEIVGLNQYGLPENIQNDPGDQLRASTFRLKREPYMSMIQRQGFFPKTEPGRDFLSDKPGRDFLEEKRLKRNLLKRFFGFHSGFWLMALPVSKPIEGPSLVKENSREVGTGEAQMNVAWASPHIVLVPDHTLRI